MEPREPYVRLWQELSADKSMIFLVGPRQSGKTTLARIIAQGFTNTVYFNWDIPQQRAILLENGRFFEAVTRKDASKPIVILDEIHKYKDWKNYLKGVYDEFHDDYHFLVTGSGRLDIYQKGGDSLAGRYFMFHLWPFTLSELGRADRTLEDFLGNPLVLTADGSGTLKGVWERLSERSGFPEPYLSAKTLTYRRWSNTYSGQLIREDIRDLSDLKSISDVETLYRLLPSRVGSPISIPSLAGDMKVSYNSVQNWLALFERFFLVFTVYPWTQKISRSVQKEKKVYLWDFPQIKDPAARFENMVAAELYRAVTCWTDMGLGDFSLHFLRNRQKEEVDFLVARDNRPVVMVEAKLSGTTPAKHFLRFQSALDVPAVQLVADIDGYRITSNGIQKVLVAPAYQWLAGLP